MYTKPTLLLVGRADEVILGVATLGTDLDGHYLPPRLGSADDPDFDDDEFNPLFAL